MIIQLKKNRIPIYWIYIQIIYSCFVKFFIAQFGIPGVANYITDIINIILLPYTFQYWNKCKAKRNATIGVITILTCFIVFTILSYLLESYSPLLYMWGFRNNFRYYLFMIECIVLLEEKDIIKILSILKKVFVVNIFIIIYQYLFKNLNGDYLSGIFGETGGNGGLNIFLSQICIVVIVYYLSKKDTFKSFVFFIVSSLIIASLSELKVFFVEVAIIFIVAMFYYKPNRRTLFTIITIFIGVVIMARVMYSLFPAFQNFFSLNTIMQYSNSKAGYTGQGDLNRLSAYQQIIESFLDTPKKMWLGIGLGNADYSTNFSFLTSDFYNRYSYLHYTWISYAFILIETGVVGLLLYFGLFIYTLVFTMKRNFSSKNRDLLLIARISCIFALIYSIYNCSLRMESGAYLFYYFLSIPFVLYKGNIIQRVSDKRLYCDTH